jgi:hypothetical protein
MGAFVSPVAFLSQAAGTDITLYRRVVDARAADLERTRTKAYLQTLQVRLGWDLIEAARRGQRTAKTIREMWEKSKQVAA